MSITVPQKIIKCFPIAYVKFCVFSILTKSISKQWNKSSF